MTEIETIAIELRALAKVAETEAADRHEVIDAIFLRGRQKA